MKYLFGGALVLGSLLLLMGNNSAGEKPKHTIGEVMKKAMAGGLCKKCASGKASDEEKAQLVELFTSLNKNEPPKGDAKAWAKKTAAILEAAKGVAKGDEKAAKALGGLTNCKACHGEFKG